MPIDQYDDEDEKDSGGSADARFKDFDCPDCNANNPCDPPVGHGDEVLCNYCGTQFEAKVTDAGKLKLREV